MTSSWNVAKCVNILPCPDPIIISDRCKGNRFLWSSCINTIYLSVAWQKHTICTWMLMGARIMIPTYRLWFHALHDVWKTHVLVNSWTHAHNPTAMLKTARNVYHFIIDRIRDVLSSVTNQSKDNWLMNEIWYKRSFECLCWAPWKKITNGLWKLKSKSCKSIIALIRQQFCTC